MNIQRSRGYTLIELTTVLAVTAILTASTVPLGSFWIERAQITEATGELTHSFGKAVATSLRNQHALNSTSAVTAVCVSQDNQLTVLEALATTPPNCSTSAGDKIWTTSLPERLSISNSGTDVSCMCFNTNGFLTTADSCGTCSVGSSLDLTVGGRTETLNVY